MSRSERPPTRVGAPGAGQEVNPRTLCIDIGGTGIKTLVVGTDGKRLSERLRVDTPRPATPRAVIKAILGLARAQGAWDRISVGFPGVVRRGVVETAHNLHPDWVGVNIDRMLTKELGKSVRAANDADVQGLGAIKGEGVELVITLGTGFGSALFVDGLLVPNVQLAHHAGWNEKTYEEELGNRAMKKAGRKKWNRRVSKAIASLSALFNFDRLYIGGGNAQKIAVDLPPHVMVVSNEEGLLGGVALWHGRENHYGVH